MYAVIRRYNVAAGAAGTMVQRANEGFAPLISKISGFVSWYLINAGDDSVVTVSVFEDRAGADESTRVASDWVKQNLASMIRTAPVILAGEVAAQVGVTAGRPA